MDTKKILSFGAHGNEAHTESRIARALESMGHEVICLHERGATAESLVAACAETKPDLLLGAKFRFAGADGFDGPSADKTVQVLARCRPHVGQIACWVFDGLMPRFSTERWQWAETLAPGVDVFAATDGSATGQFPNGLWLPQGCPDDADDEAGWPDDVEADVLFVGCAYRERHELMDNLRARFGRRFRMLPDRSAGENEVHGRELTYIVRSARICVCPHYPLWPRYWSNRMLYLARYGGLIASPTVEGMAQEGWRPSTNYLGLPNTPAAMAAKLGEFIDRTDRTQLRTIQRAGYELAKSLTYSKRCAELLRHLDARRQAAANDATGIGSDSLADEDTELELSSDSITQSQNTVEISSRSSSDGSST